MNQELKEKVVRWLEAVGESREADYETIKREASNLKDELFEDEVLELYGKNYDPEEKYHEYRNSLNSKIGFVNTYSTVSTDAKSKFIEINWNKMDEILKILRNYYDTKLKQMNQNC